MAQFVFRGTPGEDTIRALDLFKANPGFSGIIAYGGDSNDTFYGFIYGSPRVDLFFGEGGDDFFGIDAVDVGFAAVGISGGTGTDTAYWLGGKQGKFLDYRKESEFIFVFSLEDKDGSPLTANISPDVEILEYNNLSGETEYFLTEDLFNGKVREVSFEEVYYRAYGDNADWFLTGDDTYSEYVDSFSPLSLEAATVQLLYVAYYGRASDVGGSKFWQEKIRESGFSYSPRQGDGLSNQERPLYDRIVVDFGQSQESAFLYFGKSAKESANMVYNFCFDRDAEIDSVTGFNYWTEKLEKKEITLSQLAAEVALGARGVDLVHLSNKVESANRFYNALDSSGAQSGYSGARDSFIARDWLEGYGDMIATTNQADRVVNQIINTF